MKTITRIDALAFINELHKSYKELYEGYDDEYSLEEALDIISKVSSDTIEVEDVSNWLNPYLDALWEKLEGKY